MFPEGRLFDFLIVGAVALIVVGPKDLPVLMRRVGQFMARIRAMAAEFRASFDELARQSELDELRKEVDALRAARPQDFVADHLGAGEMLGDIRQNLGEANRELAAAATEPPAPAPPDPPPAPPLVAEAADAEPPAKPKRLRRSKQAAS